MKKYILLLTLVAGILYFGCQKEVSKVHTQTDLSNISVDDRSGTFLTKANLQVFQSDLVKSINKVPTTKSYSLDEICKGLEFLITVSSPSSSQKLTHHPKATKFVVDMQGSNQAIMKEVYNSAYSSLEEHVAKFNTQVYLVMFDISLEKVAEGKASFSVNSVLGTLNTNSSPSPLIPCDGTNSYVFPPNANYIVGYGDQELEILDYWNHDILFECHNCEGVIDCPVDRTGPEEVEAAINRNFPKPVSTDPTKPWFKGFVDVDCRQLTQEESRDLISGCQLYKTGDCMDNDALNCWYCETYTHMRDNVLPISIPTGKYFTSINFAIDYTSSGGINNCDRWAHPLVKYCFGTPVFSLNPGPGDWDTEDPETVPLDEL